MDRPKTRYARSDDLAIAYQVHRDGDHDLLLTAPSRSRILEPSGSTFAERGEHQLKGLPDRWSIYVAQ